jgi:hypothetical protein
MAILTAVVLVGPTIAVIALLGYTVSQEGLPTFSGQ